MALDSILPVAGHVFTPTVPLLKPLRRPACTAAWVILPSIKTTTTPEVHRARRCPISAHLQLVNNTLTTLTVLRNAGQLHHRGIAACSAHCVLVTWHNSSCCQHSHCLDRTAAGQLQYTQHSQKCSLQYTLFQPNSSTPAAAAVNTLKHVNIPTARQLQEKSGLASRDTAGLST